LIDKTSVISLFNKEITDVTTCLLLG